MRLALSMLNGRSADSKGMQCLMPVNFEKFKKYIKYDHLIDDILRDATEGDIEKFDKLKNDESMRERVLLNYYYGFYENAELIRELYPINFKACPDFIKKKIQEVPDMSMSAPENNNNVDEQRDTDSNMFSKSSNTEKKKTMKANIESRTHSSHSSVATTVVDNQQNKNRCPSNVDEDAQILEIEKLLKHNNNNNNNINMEMSMHSEEIIDEILPTTTRSPLKKAKVNIISVIDIPNTSLDENLNKNIQQMIIEENLPNHILAASSPAYSKKNNMVDESVIEISSEEYLASQNFAAPKENEMEVENIEGNSRSPSEKRAASFSAKENPVKRMKLQNISAEADEDIAADVSDFDDSEKIMNEFPINMFTDIVKQRVCKPVKNVHLLEKELPMSLESVIEISSEEYLPSQNFAAPKENEMEVENIEGNSRSASEKRAASFSAKENPVKHMKLQNISAEADEDIAAVVNDLDDSEKIMNEFPINMFTDFVKQRFCKPVKNVHLLEKELPMSLEMFKEKIDTAHVLDLMCDKIANGKSSRVQRLRANADLCENIFNNLYIQYYLNQYMESVFHVIQQEIGADRNNENEQLNDNEASERVDTIAGGNNGNEHLDDNEAAQKGSIEENLQIQTLEQAEIAAFENNDTDEPMDSRIPEQTIQFEQINSHPSKQAQNNESKTSKIER